MKHTLLSFCLLGSLLALPVLADPAVTATGDSAAATAYQFVAMQRDDLVGTVYEVDFVDTDSRQTPVLEIAAGTDKLSQMDRAKIVADRLQKASLADKSFWNTLTPTSKGSQIVVALNADDKGFIVTADKPSATLTGMSQDAYAGFLLKQIKTALVGKLRDAKFDYQLTTPEEKIERANIYRQQGEQAFQQKDDARAEAMYLQAKKVAPDYAVAYLGLASLYNHEGSADKAREVLKEGLDRRLNLLTVAQQLMPGQSQALGALIEKAKNGG